MGIHGNRVAAGMVLLLALANGAVASVELILTKDNRTFWAEKVRTNDTVILFVDNQSGIETNIFLSDVKLILPTVERGRTYTEEEVKANLKKIADARAIHKEGQKQWKSLQDQWEAVLRSDPAALNAQVETTLARFQAGRKDRAAYRDTLFTLGMLGFKDPTGVCQKRVDDATDTVQEAYLGVSIRQLESLVSVEALTTENYAKIKKLALPALRMAVDDDARRIRAVCAKARAKMIGQGEAEARGYVAGGKTLANYLKARTVLLGLLEDMAVTPEEKAGVEKTIADVTQQVRMVQRGLEFNPTNGYALSPQDRERIEATKSCRAEPMANVGPAFREDGMMILHRAPPVLTNGITVTLNTTVVLNRLSAANPDYAVALIGKHADVPARAYVKIPKKAMAAGRGDIRVPLNTTMLKDKQAEPWQDETGGYLLICIVFRPAGLPDEPDPWKTISAPYRIRVAPPAEPAPAANASGSDVKKPRS